MDLMCTSRVSVQVAGRKRWWLYPVTDEAEGNWTEVWAWIFLPLNRTITSLPLPPPSPLPQVLHPLQVTLQPGDALVWFPGWEHETRILSGLSISLSLHFMNPSNSSYQNTFSDILSERVSAHCKWRDTSHRHT